MMASAHGFSVPVETRRVFERVTRSCRGVPFLSAFAAGSQTVQRGAFCQRGPAVRRGESGVALVVVVMAMLLLAAVGAGLVLVTSTDVLIAANTGASNEAFFAADAGFERTAGELRDTPELTSVLNGAVTSAFTDGAPSGSRVLPDGSRIDLSQIVSQANCGKTSPCSTADMNAVKAERPWGALNPRWRLFSYGPLDPAQAGIRSGLPVYIVSLVADDPSETDGDPTSDGRRTDVGANPGAGVVFVRAEAFGRRGAHRIVEGVVVRRDLQALARWDAADTATRGSPPPTIPVLQVAGWRDLR